jgi:hypothetical protein
MVVLDVWVAEAADVDNKKPDVEVAKGLFGLVTIFVDVATC